MKQVLLIGLLLSVSVLGCNSPVERKVDTIYYKDFDIFTRKGIEPIIEPKEYPYFEIQPQADTTLRVILHHKEKKQVYQVPLGDRVAYTFTNDSDGPRHIFTKIISNSIISYGYEELLEKIPEEYPEDTIPIYYVLPMEVRVIQGDTIYSYFYDCFLPEGLDDINYPIATNRLEQYAIHPFAEQPNAKCKSCLVQYLDGQRKLRHYYRHIAENEFTGKNNPGEGMWLYKDEFKYWRSYYGMNLGVREK